jgi:hypothetical protein
VAIREHDDGAEQQEERDEADDEAKKGGAHVGTVSDVHVRRLPMRMRFDVSH